MIMSINSMSCCNIDYLTRPSLTYVRPIDRVDLPIIDHATLNDDNKENFRSIYVIRQSCWQPMGTWYKSKV